MNSVGVATGGGAVMVPENRQQLAARGLVIYLHCSPEQQYARTARDRNRPLLDTDDPQQKLVLLRIVSLRLRERNPILGMIGQAHTETVRLHLLVARAILAWLIRADPRK